MTSASTIGARRHRFGAGGGDQDLLFELDTLTAADRTDVALDADDHVLHEHPVVAPVVVVSGVGDGRELVDQAGAVDHHHVPVRHVLVGNRPALLAELLERQTGFDQIDVGQDLVLGDVVQLALIGRGRLAGADDCAGDVGQVPQRADHVGVEGDQVSGFDTSVAGRLEPRVGVRARGQQAALDPLAVVGDVGLVQQAPQLVLGHARLQSPGGCGRRRHRRRRSTAAAP